MRTFSNFRIFHGLITILLIATVLFGVAVNTAMAQTSPQKPSPPKWRGGHWRSGMNWPEPPVITSAAPTLVPPPSDAIVLIPVENTNLDSWNKQNWTIGDGEVTVAPKSGSITTKEKFGSIQLHVEFATPDVVTGNSQGRGNSGIFLMNHYEVQVLDCYDNPTYVDGMAGGIYKQFPPYVNVCRKPGEWQTYDIFFTRPILRIENDKLVEVIRPAYVTVIHNGVLVVNHFAIEGDTFYNRPPEYIAHGDKEPIHLQAHGNPVKFRNMWVREIPDSNIKPSISTPPHYED